MNALRPILRAMAVCVSGLGLALGLALQARAVEPDLKGIGDPTRPPPGVMQKRPGNGMGGSSSAGGAGVIGGEAGAALAAMSASAASAPAGPASGASAPTAPARVEPGALSGIRIDMDTGQAWAVIGEDVVQVGDMVNGMKVVAISRDEVQLKGPQGMRKLALPDVMEQTKAKKPARATRRGRKETT